MNAYIHLKTCLRMTIAAVFMIVQSWKQYNYPSKLHEEINCVVFIQCSYTHEWKKQLRLLVHTIHESHRHVEYKKSQRQMISFMIPFMNLQYSPNDGHRSQNSLYLWGHDPEQEVGGECGRTSLSVKIWNRNILCCQLSGGYISKFINLCT